MVRRTFGYYANSTLEALRGRAVDNKFLTVLVCVLALFAGIGLMRWMRKRTEKK